MKAFYVALIGAIITLHFSCKKTDELATDDKRKADLLGVQSQSSYTYYHYYWSDKRKIPLATDSTVAIYLTDDTATTAMKLEKLYTASTFHKFNSGYCVISANQKIALELIKDVTNAQYAYVGTSHEPLIPTGEIIVLPNPGVSIDSIIKTTNAKLSITSTNKSNRSLLKIEDNSAVLDVANHIYESGLVRYCHPDFLANIVPMVNLYSK